MPYYPEGTRYLPEQADRASDFPEIVSSYRPSIKVKPATSETTKPKPRVTDITEKWLERERNEKLRQEFYNNLNHATK